MPRSQDGFAAGGELLQDRLTNVGPVPVCGWANSPVPMAASHRETLADAIREDRKPMLVPNDSIQNINVRLHITIYVSHVRVVVTRCLVNNDS